MLGQGRSGEVVRRRSPRSSAPTLRVMPGSLTIVEANLTLEQHRRDVLAMTQAYALDPMGNGGPLPPEVLARLVPGLQRHPTTLIFLAYANEHVVGIATCFVGFSTFHGRSLVNVHDLAVLSEHRGQGIGRRLLAAAEQRARQLGCCKLTLEVQENNCRARRAYESAGFAQAVYGDSAGGVLFYTKSL